MTTTFVGIWDGNHSGGTLDLERFDCDVLPVLLHCTCKAASGEAIKIARALLLPQAQRIRSMSGR